MIRPTLITNIEFSFLDCGHNLPNKGVVSHNWINNDYVFYYFCVPSSNNSNYYYSSDISYRICC